MKKPGKEQMQAALAAAESLRDGSDKEYVGHALLYLAHRCEYLEKVQTAAERYVHFGLAEAEHARLLKAIDHARREEEKEEPDNDSDLGL